MSVISKTSYLSELFENLIRLGLINDDGNFDRKKALELGLVKGLSKEESQELAKNL